MVLELRGKTEMEGHVSGQDCADDQLPDLLHDMKETAYYHQVLTVHHHSQQLDTNTLCERDFPAQLA